MKVTIIVPAFNEEAYLAHTLDSVRAAANHLCARSDADVDIIVVDNDSEDETAAVARNKGARVVHEPVRNIARARNTGAGHAAGTCSSSSMRTWLCHARCSTRST